MKGNFDPVMRTEDDVRRYLRSRLDVIPVRGRTAPRRRIALGSLALQILAATAVLVAATTLGFALRPRTEPLPSSGVASSATAAGPMSDIDLRGVRLSVPPGWVVSERDDVLNRRMRRIVAAAPRQGVALPTVGPDGTEQPWSGAADDLLVDLREGTGATLRLPLTDSPLPLRLGAGKRESLAGYDRWHLEFVLDGRPYTLVVYAGATAPATLRSAAEAVVGSIRPAR
jgi:hypothetical protein